jgi:hypothetical protein
VSWAGGPISSPLHGRARRARPCSGRGGNLGAAGVARMVRRGSTVQWEGMQERGPERRRPTWSTARKRRRATRLGPSRPVSRPPAGEGRTGAPPYSALGEIDVAFQIGETRLILEAKWHTNKVGFGPVILLATRVRQRLEGVLGVFVSVSGYTDVAVDQVGSSGERVRIDATHVEAMLAGLASPHELIGAALEEAAATGRFYVPVAELLQPSERPKLPPMGYGPPAGHGQHLVAYAADGVSAQIVAHSEGDIRGLCADRAGRLLVVLPDGLAVVDAGARRADWVRGATRPRPESPRRPGRANMAVAGQCRSPPRRRQADRRRRWVRPGLDVVSGSRRSPVGAEPAASQAARRRRRSGGAGRTPRGRAVARADAPAGNHACTCPPPTR